MVLEPRAAATTPGARLQQAFDVASALLPGWEFTDDFGNSGSDPLSRASVGDSGMGWKYEALTMRVRDPQGGQHDAYSLLASFGDRAVPLVAFESRDGSNGCIDYDGRFGLDVANVFFSLRLGAVSADSSLAGALVGKWFSSGGMAGNLYVFGSNGRYADASAAGNWVEISPGLWTDRYATWSGSGAWTAVGNTLAFFPTGGAPTGHYARTFELRTYGGEWRETVCWVDSFEGAPYTYCTERSE